VAPTTDLHLEAASEGARDAVGVADRQQGDRGVARRDPGVPAAIFFTSATRARSVMAGRSPNPPSSGTGESP
jgi:hypothetical protein